MQAATHIRADWTAIVLGLALAALAVAGWRVDGGTMVPPAELTLQTATSETLAVSPTGRTAKGTLRASTPEAGLETRTTVRNATADALAVRLRAEPATTDLDRALTVRVAAKGQTIWEGPLGELREGMASPFVLASHETADVTVLAWIPQTSDDSTWRARTVSVRLSFLTEPTS
jgi:hypothetical protein